MQGRIQKSIVFLYASDEALKLEIENTTFSLLDGTEQELDKLKFEFK